MTSPKTADFEEWRSQYGRLRSEWEGRRGERAKESFSISLVKNKGQSSTTKPQ